MLKVCRLVVALALGLMMSLTLLTSAVFAQSTQNSTTGKATQAVTATMPQAVNRTLLATNSQQVTRNLDWGRGFRGGFFFHRGFFHRGFFRRHFFFRPGWWGGGWGGC